MRQPCLPSRVSWGIFLNQVGKTNILCDGEGTLLGTCNPILGWIPFLYSTPTPGRRYNALTALETPHRSHQGGAADSAPPCCRQPHSFPCIRSNRNVSQKLSDMPVTLTLLSNAWCIL